MSEKRFFVEEIDTNQYGIYDRLKIGYIKPLVYTDWTVGLDYTQSVCDLLNDCDEKMNEVYEKLIIGKGSSEVIDMIKFGDNLCGVAIKELFDRNKKLQEENKQLKSELNDLKDMEKSIKSERFYIHCGDDINKQLFDTESDFNIHIEEICSDEELIRLCNLLNEQHSIIRRDETSIKTMMSNMKKLEEENEQLRQFINKGRRLSVKELMDNINENELLKKENKELQTELDSFRPVLFHDMRIGTITLYSKGGIDE